MAREKPHHSTSSPRVPTIVALAQAHGSQATTPAGARRFLKARCRELSRQQPLPCRGRRAPAYDRQQTKQASRLAARQERLNRRWLEITAQGNYLNTIRAFGALPAPLQQALLPRCGGDITVWAEQRVLGLNGPRVALQALTTGHHARAGTWWVLCQQDRRLNRSRYSKSWHRAHGPVEEISNRRVVFRRLRHGHLEERTVHLDAWRGDYVARALLAAGVVPPHSGLRHVRLHPAYEVQELRRHAGYRVYRRTLCGEPVDICLVSPLGLTFHAGTLGEAFRGLKAKAAGVRPRSTGRIDLALVRQLGFCDPGIEAFADAFRLDVHGQYTPDEIYHLVQADLPAARPFLPELRLLAAAINYPVPDPL